METSDRNRDVLAIDARFPTTRRLSRTNTKIMLKNSQKHSADLSKRNAGNRKGHRETKIINRTLEHLIPDT